MQILLGLQHLRRCVSVLFPVLLIFHFPVFISTYHFISISCFSKRQQICMESCAILFHVCLRRKTKLQSPRCQFKIYFHTLLLLQSTWALQLVQLAMKQVISMCIRRGQGFSTMQLYVPIMLLWPTDEEEPTIVSTKLLVCSIAWDFYHYPVPPPGDSGSGYINGGAGKAPGLVTAKTLSGYLASWGDSGYDMFTFLFETNCRRQSES